MTSHKNVNEDILDALIDLHKQATTEHSHYYTEEVLGRAIIEIIRLRTLIMEGDTYWGPINEPKEGKE